MLKPVILFSIFLISSVCISASVADNEIPFETASGNGGIFRFEGKDLENPFMLFTINYSRPYDMDELKSYNTSLFWYNKILLGIEYSYFGTDWYNENEFSAVSGMFCGKYFLPELDFNCRMTGYNFNGNENYSYDFDSDIHLDMRISDYFSFSVLYKYIFSSALNQNSRLLSDYSAGIRISPFSGLALDYNYSVSGKNYINSAGATINILSNLILETGCIYETDSVYIAARIFVGNYRLTYSCSYHSYLGTTHTAGISFATGRFTVKPFNYGMQPTGKDITQAAYIDMQTCTAGELAAIEGISDEDADKIINLRKTGTVITLQQLQRSGFSKEQINMLKNHSLTEIPSEPEGRPRVQQTLKSANKKLALGNRAELLNSLLDADIPPAQAYSISEKSSSLNLTSIIKWIDSLPELSEAEKLRAKTVCAKMFSR